jgi:hypothetical protein
MIQLSTHYPKHWIWTDLWLPHWTSMLLLNVPLSFHPLRATIISLLTALASLLCLCLQSYLFNSIFFKITEHWMGVGEQAGWCAHLRAFLRLPITYKIPSQLLNIPNEAGDPALHTFPLSHLEVEPCVYFTRLHFHLDSVPWMCRPHGRMGEGDFRALLSLASSLQAHLLHLSPNWRLPLLSGCSLTENSIPRIWCLFAWLEAAALPSCWSLH